MIGAPFFEVCAAQLTAKIGGDEVELPLQRDQSGQITASCRGQILAIISGLLRKHEVRRGIRALCAIDGRGVSLRRLSLPASPKEEFQRLLRLQLEREFPIAPEQLAWGSRVLRQDASHQEILVAAIRKEALQPLADLFSSCGLETDFTVCALWEAARFETPPDAGGVLYLGRCQSELLIYEGGFPVAIRVLGWGRENFGAAGLPELPVPKIYLTDGESAALVSTLKGISCERLPPVATPNTEALILRSKEPPRRVTLADVKSRKPLVLAAALACAVLGFPFVQALAFKPFLSHHLARLKSGSARLDAIDREIDFLQYLKASQPPYLDTLFLMAKAAPPGTSFESISLGRRGEISLRGKLANAQQVTDFRSRLIEAGWFSSVTVDEQTPTPDRRVTVRMTAQLKDAASRKPIPEEQTPK